MTAVADALTCSARRRLIVLGKKAFSLDLNH
jgi:hypothetical protein